MQVKSMIALKFNGSHVSQDSADVLQVKHFKSHLKQLAAESWKYPAIQGQSLALKFRDLTESHVSQDTAVVLQVKHLLSHLEQLADESW